MCDEITALLKREGYKLNDDIANIESVAEYIDMMQPDYSVEDWFYDTKNNYPEYLVRLCDE